MNVTFAQVETIMNTLPIGYYAGRRVPAKLEKDTAVGTSYYSATDESIVIEYNLIAERMKLYPDNANVEEAIRSMLYHEVSHAILTPSVEMHSYSTSQEFLTVMNIFEDERIETVLKSYYMDVDFKKQIHDIAKPHSNDSDPISVFFDLVRFGIGTKSQLNRVQEIISDYASVNRASSHTYVWCYCSAVWNLYWSIKNNMSCPNASNGQDRQQAQNGMPQDTEANANAESNNTCPLTSEQVKELVDTAMNNKTIYKTLSGNKEELDVKKSEELLDFEKAITRIIDNFHRKNNAGSGINTYSGVFNPRALLRDDYRYFERSFTSHSNNKFGACHLNCFIDCSGSFRESAPLVNRILGVLTRLEKHHPNFTISVVHINDEWHEAQSVLDREFVAENGNTLPEDVKERFIKLQKRNTYVHNLVLFDGDAFSEGNYRMSRRKELFRTFDTSTTTLISDRDNEDYYEDFKSAQVIETNCYTEELIKNILLSLQKAFS